MHIGLVGVEGAGKTTIRQRLRNNQLIPVQSFSEEVRDEYLQIRGLKISVWDLAPPIAFPGYNVFIVAELNLDVVEGLIFVGDISDTMFYPSSRGVLEMVMNKTHATQIPIAIFGNKVDLLDLRDTIPYLSGFLDPTKYGDRQVGFFMTSGKTGEGLSPGFVWLIDAISERGHISEEGDYLTQLFSELDLSI